MSREVNFLKIERRESIPFQFQSFKRSIIIQQDKFDAIQRFKDIQDLHLSPRNVFRLPDLSPVVKKDRNCLV